LSKANTFKFLLRPSWLAGHVLVIALTLLLSSLGFWQLDRLRQSKEQNKIIKNRLSQITKNIDEIGSDYKIADIEFSRLQLLGQYDPAHEILLRGRSYAGLAGYNLFTPFITTNKKVVMVERGWVPIEYDSPPVLAALPPKGIVEIIAIILSSSSPPQGWNKFFAPKDPPGELKITAYTDLKRLQKQMPYKLESFYLRLLEQKPLQNESLPYALKPLEINNGSHLSYALQWFSFVVIGLVGYGLIIRQRYLNSTQR